MITILVPLNFHFIQYWFESTHVSFSHMIIYHLSHFLPCKTAKFHTCMNFETMKLGNSNWRLKVTDSTSKFRSLRFSNLIFRLSRYGLTTCRIFDIKLAYMNLFKRKKSDWRFVKIRNTQIITILKKRFKMYHWRVLSYSRNRFGLRRDCDVLRRCSSD